jgi:hypothetical protein
MLVAVTFEMEAYCPIPIRPPAYSVPADTAMFEAVTFDMKALSASPIRPPTMSSSVDTEMFIAVTFVKAALPPIATLPIRPPTVRLPTTEMLEALTFEMLAWLL